ncbi:MAG: toxin-antitoxin system YwqK family antitoxin [Bacteroidales bacterium]|nr:toxin-antitoxin system YwqK family antitoxin [Bacteroidales bacterium]
MRTQHIFFISICITACFFISCKKVEEFHDPFGRLACTMETKKGVADGVTKFYFNDGVSVKQETYYKNGKLNGPSKRWFYNGKTEVEEYYINDSLDGTKKIWDEKGQLIVEDHYTMGILNGTSKKWYSNGQLQIDAFFIDGLADGEWKYYNSNGIEVGYASFNMGTGEQIGLDDKGNIKEIIKYENGVKID